MTRSTSSTLKTAPAGSEYDPQARFLRRSSASRYLSAVWGIDRAPTTLAKLACVGGGPAYLKAGRAPLYRPEDLDAWARRLLGLQEGER